jgi:hypothetical protein
MAYRKWALPLHKRDVDKIVTTENETRFVIFMVVKIQVEFL